jgi:ABC-type multidrug transport system fused ATPase/permease subunit
MKLPDRMEGQMLEPLAARPGVGVQQAPMLATRRLSRTVGGKRLIDNISVAVEPGEVLAIVGPSGAGKSSFLRLLNRLDEPTGGTVLLDRQDYKAIPPRELRRASSRRPAVER